MKLITQTNIKPALLEEHLTRFTNKNLQTTIFSVITEFFDFLTESFPDIKHPREVESYHFAAYASYLVNDAATISGKKISENTVAARWSHVRSFWKFLKIKRVIPEDESVLISIPKPNNESDYIALSPKQIRSIVNTYPSEELNEPKKLISQMTAMLLALTGVRCVELGKIKFGSFKYNSRYDTYVLEVIGKGNKPRVIPVDNYLYSFIQNYKENLSKRIELKMTNDDYLFQSNYYHKSTKKKNEKPVNESTIFRTIIKIIKDSPIKIKISPHSFRATYITQLLDDGVDIYMVATWAGHSSVDTTKAYDKNRQRLKMAATPSYGFLK
ncbi:hypothetical protein A9Q84_07770 [Halobacteriovorax marinus]|uniref:Integrase n=1 Tax=Halobacteriovorax marinus TaxID=97084 RepID=A0A1Y5F5T6_9BACT|nr:hypothetical protein A9Q84_07770 [Halobacteriovorax marinus]